jgi:hypothetical protein
MADEKIFWRPIRPTYQRNTEAFVKTPFGFLDCLNAHQTTRHFLAAGVPISSKRPRNQRGATDSGTKDCVYREASGQFDSPSQAMGPIERRIPEWSGHASLRGISQKTWLKNLIEKFKCNIFLTDRFNESFHKSIVCWFPKEKIFVMRKNRV